MEKKVIILISIVALVLIVFVTMQFTGNAVVIDQSGQIIQSSQTSSSEDATQFPSNPKTSEEFSDSVVSPVNLQCGDGICQIGEEGQCAADCAVNSTAICGNAICEDGENYISCAIDCPASNATCGDGICDSNIGENITTCIVDCNISIGGNETGNNTVQTRTEEQVSSGGSGGSNIATRTSIDQVVEELQSRGQEVYKVCTNDGQLAFVVGVRPDNQKVVNVPEDCLEPSLAPSTRIANAVSGRPARERIIAGVVSNLFGIQ